MSARAVRAELASILARADGSREDSAEFSAAEMNGWDAGLRQALTSTRLLQRGRPRQAVPCSHCDEDHLVEVSWEGQRALGWCPTSGRITIAPALLDTFVVSLTRLAEALQSLLGTREPLHELATGRLWRLGVLAGTPPTTAFLARGFQWNDSPRVFAHPGLRRSDGALLLTLSEAYSDDPGIRIVPLTRVLTVDARGLAVDLRAAAAAVSEKPPADAGYTFRREGSGWHVTYKDETASFSEMLGFTYVRLLLMHPTREFTPADLVALSSDRSDTPPIRARDEDGLSGGEGLGDTIIDARGLGELRGRIAELRSEGRPSEAAELEHYLRQATRPGGRAKRFESEVVQSARNVRRAISRALDSMSGSAPQLALHLKKSIASDRAKPLSYRPEHLIRWLTD